ncbi:hypothetical protein N1851_000011 [Merluccius polli]|uniref:Uncharacterized protein n=1 Tax=Merluccius polli TaxID=89951 RepID=A0AA47NE08_MERPO|nr:hypothetical protein N1851_000011 [Merluccius polli]
MCEEVNVEAVLKQKWLRTTKRHFGYEAPVHTVHSSRDDQNLGQVNDKFGVLLNMAKEELLEHCQTLSTALTHDGQPDGRELAVEMLNFVPQYLLLKGTYLKLIQIYLRFTVVQELLSGLSIISINHVVSQ